MSSRPSAKHLGDPLKRLLLALFLASVVCTFGFVTAATAKHGVAGEKWAAASYTAAEWDAVTRSFALDAAKIESAAWLKHWKKLEPNRRIEPGVSGSKMIWEFTAYTVLKVGPCFKGNIVPMFCRQKTSYAWTQHVIVPGEPEIVRSGTYCFLRDLRVGPLHSTRRASLFSDVGTRYDVPLKGFGFATVESPPEHNSC